MITHWLVSAAKAAVIIAAFFALAYLWHLYPWQTAVAVLFFGMTAAIGMASK